jgi:hypothetical protein
MATISLLVLATLAWGVAGALAEDPTRPEAARAQAGQPTTSANPLNGPEGWRYTWSRGRWWYWLPEQRWMFWERGRWVDYTPTRASPDQTPRPTFADGTVPAGQPGYPTGQTYSSAYPPAETYVWPCPIDRYRAARPDYGPGWGWGHGWNGQGYRWRSEWR